MSVAKFFDTNVLVYAYDLKEPTKRPIALKLIQEGWNELGSVAVSIQVLQELFVALGKRGISRKEAITFVNDFGDWTVVENTFALLQAGLKEQERWNTSFWDGLILAAARASGAAELISEDFSHGQNYDGIRAINPFR